MALVRTDGAARTALRQSGTKLRGGSIDADALAGIGIDLDAVRRQADAVFGPDALLRAGRRSRGHVLFSPHAKKAPEAAERPRRDGQVATAAPGLPASA